MLFEKYVVMLAVIFNSLSQSPSFLPIFMYCLYNLLSSFDNFLMFSVTQGGTLSSAVISLFGTKLVNIFNKNYLMVAVLMNRRENNTIRNHIRLISECKVITKTGSRKEMSWFRWEYSDHSCSNYSCKYWSSLKLSDTFRVISC